jgi:nucleoid-associated protein YgaU
VANEGGSATGSGGLDSQTNASAVAQTANIGRSTSVTSGAAKVFREFKWGLLTLFLLMVVVIGLVYDGGKKKKPATADLGPLPDDRASQIALDGPEPGAPPTALPQPVAPGVSSNTQPNPGPIAQNDLLHEPSVPPLAPPTTPEPRPLGPVVTPPTQPVPPIAPAPVAGEKTYVVKGGDTLTSIASSQLPGKGGLKSILDSNKDVLPNPNKLRVGMTLKIPSAVATAPAKAEKSEKADAVPTKKGDIATIKEPAQDVHSSATEYVVQGGDTLERIARKVFNDPRKWHEIYEWNRDQLPDPGRLHVGQTLKMKGGAGTATTTTVPTPPAKSGRAEIIDEPVHTPASTLHTKGAVASGKEVEEPAVMSSSSGANIP